MRGKFLVVAVLAVVVAACSGDEVAGPGPNSNSPSTPPWVWQNPLPLGNEYLGVETLGDGQAIAITQFEALKTTDGGNTWERIDIDFSGRVKILDIYRRGGVTTILGRGFVLISVDDGRSWRLNDAPGRAEALAFWDADNGIVVGDDGTIATTNDGGESWTDRPSGAMDLEDVEFLDSQTVFTGGDDIMLRSTDGGATWSALDSLEANRVNAIDITSGIVRLVDGAGLVCTSTDQGESWSAMDIANADLYDIDFIDAQNGITAGHEGQIYVTSDGGTTWSASTPQISVEINAVSFALSDSWAAGEDGEIYRSTNMGNTWDAVHTGHSIDLVDVSFANVDIGMAVGASCGLLTTVDGGESWARGRITGDLTLCGAGDLTSVWMTGTRAVVVGAGGEIWTTLNRGPSWTKRVSGTTLDLCGVAFADENTGIVVGDLGLVLVTSDGGVTWTPSSAGTGERLTAVAFASPEVVMIVGENGTVRRSVDGGASWGRAETKVPDITLEDIAMVDSETAFTLGYEATRTAMLRTTDGGASWEKQFLTGSLHSVAFGSATRGYAVGGNGIVHLTEDGGTTWEFMSRASIANLRGVHALDGGIATIVGDDGTILRTTTGAR